MCYAEIGVLLTLAVGPLPALLTSAAVRVQSVGAVGVGRTRVRTTLVDFNWNYNKWIGPINNGI